MRGPILRRRVGWVSLPAAAIGIVLALLMSGCAGSPAVTTSTALSGTTATAPSGQVTTSSSTTAGGATNSSTGITGTPVSYPPASQSQYTVLAVNDLGMHCIQADYSAMLILPPANFLNVQVFKKGGEGAQLVTSGITVEYAVNNMGDPTAHSNFWQYAKNYGFNVEAGKGIRPPGGFPTQRPPLRGGNGLGACPASKRAAQGRPSRWRSAPAMRGPGSIC